MLSLSLSRPFAPSKPSRNSFVLTARMRAIVAAAGIVMTLLTFYALTRGLLGFVPSHPNIKELAIAIHVATVTPAIPLGGYQLLAPKGTSLHKMLGKVWVTLMVTTAISAIFIKTGGTFSFIHIFVPITLWASYQLIAKARRGDMAGHKKEVVNLYLYALMIPGVFSMILPGRLMNVWLFG